MNVDDSRAAVMSLMRTYYKGTLEDDIGVRPTHFVFASRLGKIVFPSPRPKHLRPDQPIDMEADRHATLHVPDEGSTSAQLHLRLFPLVASADLHFADRWQAYHGRPSEPQFYSAQVLSARAMGIVIDGEDVVTYNPLEDAESKLVKRVNISRDKLSAMFEAATRLGPIHEAVAVGIDPHGIDLRTRVGIVRMPLRAVSMDANAAELTLTEMGL